MKLLTCFKKYNNLILERGEIDFVSRDFNRKPVMSGIYLLSSRSETYLMAISYVDSL